MKTGQQGFSFQYRDGLFAAMGMAAFVLLLSGLGCSSAGPRAAARNDLGPQTAKASGTMAPAVPGRSSKQSARTAVERPVSGASVAARSGTALHSWVPVGRQAPKSDLDRARLAYDRGDLREAETILVRLVAPLTARTWRGSSGGAVSDDMMTAALLLGRLRVSQRRYKEAQTLAQSVLARKPKALGGHLLLARSLYLANELGHALRAAQAGIGAAPRSGAAQRMLGECLIAYRQWAAAMASLQKAVRLDPSSAWSQVLLGDVLWAKRRYNEAEVAYRKAVDLAADGVGWQAIAMDRLGTLLLARHRRPEAAKMLSQCKKRFVGLGCPYTEASFLAPDPTRPERRETFVRPRHYEK